MSHILSRRSLLSAGLVASAVSALPLPSIIRPANAVEALPVPAPQGYDRLFPGLAPAKFAPEDLVRLAQGDGNHLNGMSADPETLKNEDKSAKRDTNGHLIISATPEDEQDDEENFGLASGYTYLGQFIDHDLTLNPTSEFTPMTDGSVLTNLRTPAFDLDSLYGRGPADQPYLFEADGKRLMQGRALTRSGEVSTSRDLPRVNGRAAIGDKRNDENVIISQLHSAFTAFHNKVVADMPNASFEEVRRVVTHHYQWVVLTDFLPRIVGPKLMDTLLPGFGAGGKAGSTQTRLTLASKLGSHAIPLEFTDAAYRFGHSMIRPAYRLNARMKGSAAEMRDNPALAGRRLIFAASPYAGLNGFRAFPAEWAIDWRLYFEIDRKLELSGLKDGVRRVQAAYKFDTSLVNPLAFLPEFSQGPHGGPFTRDADGQSRPKAGAISSLALRNLMRGAQRGLPSGQDVARAMGIDPVSSRDLKVGKATVEGLAVNRSITAYGESFQNAAPLWFYVLAEAQALWAEDAGQSTGSKAKRDAIPSRLGPVGGRIVAESFIAMMARDKNSVLHAGADWAPRFTRDGRFAMPELLGQAGLV